jgi:glycosyltransferase involved in cell wall biosynthesis
MRYLMRRNLPGLASKNVISLLLPEAVRRMERLVPRIFRPSHEDFVRYQNWLFEILAVRHMPSATRIVYSPEGAALRILRKASRKGAVSLLEGTVHPKHLVKILRPEYDRLQINDDWLSKAWVNKVEAEIAAADFVVTQSTFAAQTYVQNGVEASRLEVVPLGVDLEVFSPPAVDLSPSNSLRVLYVGQLSVRKGVPRLLEAMEEIGNPLVNLTLIGLLDDELVPFFKVKFRALRDRVKWIPGLSRSDLVVHYQSADVVVLASLCDSFGQSVLESMACGTPGIVSDACGVPVKHGQDGIVVPAGDTEALARSLEQLASNRGMLSHLGQSATRTARMYGWDRYRLQMVELLSAKMSA